MTATSPSREPRRTRRPVRALGAALTSRGDLTAYVPIAMATTAASVAGRERLHLATKMLLAPTLGAGIVATRGQRSSARTATLVASLVGSTVGDWFMNASGRAATPQARRLAMRRGAGSFAVQQAGLITLLLRDGARPALPSGAVVASVMAGLGLLDSLESGEPDPVLTGYGVLLGGMAALAVPGVQAATRGQRRAVTWGGALFLLSDATIIIGEHLAKSPRQRAVASGIVMSTYTAALALLVHGLRDEPAPLATSTTQREVIADGHP